MRESSTDCRRIERELAALAGAQPDEALERHLAACPGCRDYRARILHLSAGMRRELPGPALALALARAARDGGGLSRRGTPLLWPLFSASLTAAVLILHFGLAPTPAPRQEPQVPSGAEAHRGLPSVEPELALPEALAPYERLAFPTGTGRDPS